jgi:hypothetical protein
VIATRPRTQSGGTASTLILIGFILQVIEVAIFLLIGLVFLVIPIVGLFVFALALIGVVWLILVWVYSYTPTAEGNYEGARTPTLVFGILSLLTLGLISGILYIIAYAKRGDAEREAAQAVPGWGVPPPFAPSYGMPPTPPLAAAPNPGTKFCSYCGRPNAASATFCQSCGARIG